MRAQPLGEQAFKSPFLEPESCHDAHSNELQCSCAAYANLFLNAFFVGQHQEV